jgi:hypothetical protein
VVVKKEDKPKEDYKEEKKVGFTSLPLGKLELV